MKRTEPKSQFFFRFRIFGFHIYISRNRLKRRPSPELRSKTRRNAKYMRLEKAGNRCELCGIMVDNRCTLHHLLPIGDPGRNKVENVRVICSQCNEHVHRVGSFRPMIGLRKPERKEE